jgi:signal transduction histidine kinase
VPDELAKVLPDLGDLSALGGLFHDSRLPMWIHDGASLQVLAVNRAARSAYGWDDDVVARLTIDDVHPRGAVSAQEFRSGERSVWVVTELDGAERLAQDAEHDRVLHELIEVQERLRSNIAERLHDGPVQTLTAVSLRIGLLKRSVDPALEPKVAEAERLVVDALGSLRREMNEHRSPGEIASDLRGAIASTLRWFGLDDRYRIETMGADPGGWIAALLYRVAQDLLAASRHEPPDTGVRTIVIHVMPVGTRLSVPVAEGVRLGERLVAWATAMGGTIERVERDGTTSVVVTIPAGT